MKKILLLVLLSSLSVFSQQYDKRWKKVIENENAGKFKSANAIVEKIYNKASRQQDEAQLIKCFFYQSKYSQVIDENAQSKIIDNLKIKIDHATIPTKALLNVIYAKILNQYYVKNGYIIRNRTNTTVENDDFLTWTKLDFETHIEEAITESLENETILKQTRLSKYDILFDYTEAIIFETQTLLDYILKENITLYTSKINYWQIKEDDFIPYHDILYGSSTNFCNLKLDFITNENLNKTLSLYQKQELNSTSSDLKWQRFLFVKTHILPSEMDWLSILENLQKTVDSKVVKQKIKFEKAKSYIKQASKDAHPDYNIKASEVLDSIITLNDRSNVYKRAIQSKHELELKSVSINFEKYTYPKQNSRAYITYKNIDSVRISFYKINQRDSNLFAYNYHSRDSVLNDLIVNRMPIASKNYQLKNPKTYFEYTTEVILPQLELGTYLVFFESENDIKNTKAFGYETITATNFSIIASANSNIQEFQIVDRHTGIPIEGAKILTDKFIATTDKEGKAYNSKEYDRLTPYLTIIKEKDTLNLNNSFINVVTPYPEKQKAKAKVEIYLDRAIYRPGQTIYFKGIAFQKKQGKSAVVPFTSFKVTINDPNNNTINEVDLVTNEFGSFSGEYILPKSGLVGGFKIEVEQADHYENDLQYNSKLEKHSFWDEVDFEKSFNFFTVEEYKRPKFEITFNPTNETYTVNDEITITGTTNSFTGSAVSNAVVKYSVRQETYKSKSGTNYEWSGGKSQIVLEAETKTDDTGKFNIQFIAKPDLDVKKEDLPIFSYRLTLQITDNNGETQTLNQQLVTNVGYHALKLKATLPKEIETKDKNTLLLESTNLNNTFIPTVGILKFYRVRKANNKIKPRIWEKPELESISDTEFEKLFPFEQNEKAISEEELGELVHTTNVNTEKRKTIDLNFISDWETGMYKLVFSAKDKFGNDIETKTQFNLIQSSQLFNPNTLFTAEQLNSNPGQDGFIKIKIKSIIPSLHINSSANYKYWNFYNMVTTINSNEGIITIPLRKEFEKAITINFTSVFENTVFEKKLEIILNNIQPKLNFEVASFRSKIEPGKLENWSFKLNAIGTEKESEILASMYDKSLDLFTKKDWELLDFQDNNYYYASNTKTALGFQKTYSYIQNLNTHLNEIKFKDVDTDLLWFGFNINTIENKYTLLNYKKQHSKKLREPANAKLISGIVSDPYAVLPGVTISIKGTKRQTVSDFDGYYEIAATLNETLIFSFIGYTTVEHNITGNTIDKQLKPDESTLEEVIVVGYGTMKKKSSTTTLSGIVDEADYQVYNTAGIILPLTGKAAGINLADLKTKIRGTSTISQNNNPLYVIDGKIVLEQAVKDLTASDVISVDVLKSDQATALYGGKGANGAIVIITKKGLGELNQIKARTNLSETAFFLPDLRTDKKGNLSFNFKSPEALTAWKFRLLAHNKEAVSSYLEKNVITQKELMVIPNFPRFFREKDSIVITAKISNMTSEVKTGIARLQFFDATNMQNVDVAMANTKNARNFNANPLGNTTVSWKIFVPEGLQGLQYKIVAKAGNYSDGEESVLPVLTNNILVTESIPVWIRENSKKEYVFENLKNTSSPTLKNHQFTLEYTSNPAWIAIHSLPYLMDYEHESAEQSFARYYANALATNIINSNPKIAAVFESWSKSGKDESKLKDNEELKSIILAETPWVNDAKTEDEKKTSMALLFDLEKMKNMQEVAFKKLTNQQTTAGGFTWFGGNEPNEYITRHIVAGLGHLLKLNAVEESNSKILEITSKAVPFIDGKFLLNYKSRRQETNLIDKIIWTNPRTDLHYLYSRSFYLKTNPPSDSLKLVMNRFIENIKTNWLSYSLYEKGLAAITLNRFDDKETAKKIIVSLKETSSTNVDWGMYWIDNKEGWYWYQAPIETQAILIEAFAEITNDKKSVDAMKVWLIKNKQSKNWPSTKSTTEAIYALLLQGSDWLSVKDNTVIKVGDQKILTKKLNENKKEAETGYLKINWKSSEINDEMAKIEISNKSDIPGYGGIYWQYFENLDKIESDSKNSLSISKELYLKTGNGKDAVLTKIKAPLTIGDLITVRLIISTNEDMEFVHLKDMRASCFEPIDVLSSYQYQGNLGFYKATKDAATHFFFDKIGKGTYVLEYDTRVNNKGSFSNGITTIQSMYAPEFSIHSQGIQVKVKD
ncbi:MG2 domain-containing protein [Flavobacterium frigidarium]|uniref:MG2 domain-containing protein n=1 Tax=Flavobacterium frigidarium TaxID=99286 RepID=A0ABV4K9S0_9FLAO